VDIGAIEREYGIDFHAYFAGDLAELEVHEREGMARLTDTAIEATAVGELFVRNLAMCFDRYQRERHANAERPVFSRTV
jgi:oxygen-independent coproporphyrinogen-3 oxidase